MKVYELMGILFEHGIDLNMVNFNTANGAVDEEVYNIDVWTNEFFEKEEKKFWNGGN